MGISSALGSSALLPAGLGFRNVIINGDFRINQRGFTTTQTSGAYGFDRWAQYVSDGTVTYTPQTFTVGNAIPGYEPTNYAQIVTTGQTLASARASLWQAIEGVRTFAGQTVTVSFWAKATSGTPKVAVTWQQAFGTSGSSPVDTFFGQVTLSTSWARYTITGQMPSISGKTIGTANDALWLGFYFSAGSNYNTPTGTLGIQSNTFQIWGVQAEANYQPTPFEQRPINVELALCQRYYSTIQFDIEVYALTSISYVAWLALPQPLRASPTIVANMGGSNYTNGSLFWQSSYPNAVRVTVTVTTNAYTRINSSPASTFSAEL